MNPYPHSYGLNSLFFYKDRFGIKSTKDDMLLKTKKPNLSKYFYFIVCV